MKDLSKLFKTIIDFKGLPFIVTKQSTIKKLRLVFFGHGYSVMDTRFWYRLFAPYVGLCYFKSRQDLLSVNIIELNSDDSRILTSGCGIWMYR